MRQFVSETGLDSDGCIKVGGGKFRYLASVLRLEEGDMLYVRLPSGALQPMTVARVDGQSKTLTLSLAGSPAKAADASGSPAGDLSAPPAGSALLSAVKAAPLENAGRFRFHLFQLVPKPPKMDLIIRQATECGVSSIIPVAGEFCQKGNVESAVKKSSPADSRWQKVITEAREQSGSPVQTEVLPCKKFEEALAFWKEVPGGGLLGEALGPEAAERGGPERGTAVPTAPGSAKMAFILYERNENTLPVHRAVARAAGRSSPLKNAPETADIAVMVGAEGGISPSELEKAKESGFIPVHLETNILRCETAALYGLAVIQGAVMESDIWKLNE